MVATARIVTLVVAAISLTSASPVDPNSPQQWDSPDADINPMHDMDRYYGQQDVDKMYSESTSYLKSLYFSSLMPESSVKPVIKPAYTNLPSSQAKVMQTLSALVASMPQGATPSLNYAPSSIVGKKSATSYVSSVTSSTYVYPFVTATTSMNGFVAPAVTSSVSAGFSSVVAKNGTIATCGAGMNSTCTNTTSSNLRTVVAPTASAAGVSNSNAASGTFSVSIISLTGLAGVAVYAVMAL